LKEPGFSGHLNKLKFQDLFTEIQIITVNTIVLTLIKELFQISAPDKFEITARWILTDNLN